MTRNFFFIIISVYLIFILGASSYAESGSVLLPSSFYMGYTPPGTNNFSQRERLLAVEDALDAAQAALSSNGEEMISNTGTEIYIADEPAYTAQKETSAASAVPFFEAEETPVNVKPADEQPGSDFPEWLKRTSFGTVIESGQDPRLYFETVQPLYQSSDNAHTLLTQGRVSISGDDENYSAGLGYRHLFADTDVLLGINNFFDYKSNHQHYRTGVGLEAISNALEFRANSYFGLSPDRLVEEIGDFKIYERAASGFDLEMGGSLSALDWIDENQDKSLRLPSWLKIFGGLYWYNFQNSSNVSGWKLRGEIKPLQGVGLNLAMLSDNKDDRHYQLDLRVHLSVADFRPKSIFSAFKSAVVPSLAASSLVTRMLDRVERSFDVKVELWSVAPLPVVNPGIITSVGNITNVQLVVRFPGIVPATTDTNSNGAVDPGESFEVDILATNSSGLNSTFISYVNAAVSNSAILTFNNSGVFPDIPSGSSALTDSGSSDLDLQIDAGATAGTQFNIILDFTADGQTRTLTFGPFTIGSIVHGQVVDQI